MERDANIERLFDKVDAIADTVLNNQKELSAILTKIDDFAYRLRKLEERDEKHVDREKKVELLISKIENIVERNESTMTNLETRVDILEKDMTILKNNWGWAVAIVSAIGGVAGYVISQLMSYFRQ